MPETKFANSRMEKKFSLHAAEEVIAIWTGIWTEKSQIKAFMA